MGGGDGSGGGSSSDGGGEVSVAYAGAAGRLEVVPLDLSVATADDIRRALDGAAIVVYAETAYGGRAERGSPYHVDYLGIKHLLAATVRSPVRVVYQSSTATRGVVRPLIIDWTRDNWSKWKREAEKLLKASAHPYTIVRAGRLTRSAGGVRGIRLRASPSPTSSPSPLASVFAATPSFLPARPVSRGDVGLVLARSAVHPAGVERMSFEVDNDNSPLLPVTRGEGGAREAAIVHAAWGGVFSRLRA